MTEMTAGVFSHGDQIVDGDTHLLCTRTYLFSRHNLDAYLSHVGRE